MFFHIDYGARWHAGGSSGVCTAARVLKGLDGMQGGVFEGLAGMQGDLGVR